MAKEFLDKVVDALTRYVDSIEKNEEKELEPEEKATFRDDWREKCCCQCKYHFIEHKGKKYPCSFSLCSDEEALRFDETNGCQGVYEYLKTGVFPERGRK